MSYLIESTLYLSVTALFLLIFKKLFKNRLPAKWHVWIWALLLIRLVVPSLPQSEFSIFNAVKMSTQSDVMLPPDSDIVVKQNTQEIIYTEANTDLENKKFENKGINFDNLVLWIWKIGGTSLLLYFLLIYCLCVCRVSKYNQITDKNTYALLADCLKKLNIKRKVYLLSGDCSPMLVGMIKPKIILPEGYTDSEKRDILTHELCHLKNGDILIIWIAMLVLCINWFNPIIWYSFFIFRKDIEVYCDARVLKYSDSKKAYAGLLLKTALKKNRFIAGTTLLQNGEKEVERRIKYMAYSKKPKIVLTAVIAIIVIIIGAVCLTNEKTSYAVSDEKFEEIRHKIVGSQMVDIAYADSHKAVFYYYDSIFVFDIDEKKITQSFDLDKLNCAKFQQGDFTLDIKVSADGKEALLKNIGNKDHIKDLDNYIINLKNGDAKKTDIDELNNTFALLSDFHQLTLEQKGWISDKMAEVQGVLYYLILPEGKNAKLYNVNLMSVSSVTKELKEYYVFNNNVMPLDKGDIIRSVLPEGVETYVNSAYNFYCNLVDMDIKEAERLADFALGESGSYKKLSKEIGFDILKYTGREVEYLININESKENDYIPYLYVFDYNTEELLGYVDLKTRETELKYRDIFIELEKNSKDF